MRIARTLPILSLLLWAGACSPGFDDIREIKDLRVLGARVDPVEVVVPANPALLESALMNLEAPYEVGEPMRTELVLLVANPEAPEAPVNYELRGCVLGGDFRCREGLPDELLASGTLTPGETAIPVTFSVDLIGASIRNDPFFGIFGAAVWLRGELQQGDVRQLFLKSFVVMPDYEGGREANQDPTISDILAGDEDEEIPLELDASGVWHVPSAETVRLLPVIPEEDRQTFLVFSFSGELAMDAQGEIREETEEMTVRFFSTCGAFSSEYKTEQTFIFLETEEDRESKNLSVEWTAPGEPELCQIWFVVEDGRGGTNWLELPVSVD